MRLHLIQSAAETTKASFYQAMGQDVVCGSRWSFCLLPFRDMMMQPHHDKLSHANDNIGYLALEKIVLGSEFGLN